MLQPQHQGYEEVGDDGIVPSTPTLFVPRRREGFGEGVSSPQVPQAQGRAFTFAPESSHTSISSAQGKP
jgi:nucleoprotein TPR